MSALKSKVNGYVSAMESADGKAKFHGEASMREEFGVLTLNDRVLGFGSDYEAAKEALRFSRGRKLVRRTVSVSQWVEVDA